MIGAKIGIGIAGLALTGWAASQSWVGAIILSVFLAAILWAMLLMLRLERVRPTESTRTYSADPIHQVGSTGAATGIPASSRASLTGPQTVNLTFVNATDDQVASVVRELPR